MKTKSKLSTLLILFTITLFTHPALGQLVWQQRTVDRRASLDDRAATVDYHFSNQGDYSVTIKSVKSGCGCTTAKLEKHTYQPGDAGTITLTFTFGNKTGRQRNHAIVRTDDLNLDIANSTSSAPWAAVSPLKINPSLHMAPGIR